MKLLFCFQMEKQSHTLTPKYNIISKDKAQALKMELLLLIQSAPMCSFPMFKDTKTKAPIGPSFHYFLKLKIQSRVECEIPFHGCD
ncbi:hypothetical protein JHK85_027933 [Glycine max]|uniref:Uncharacterized protein n=1 Tax=Glycine max TaxID=3847 RepID=A0A0R0I1M2_SOYBN|nr:hypothetical protein JHK87_027196 [Glycine soja]KAG4996494.1 hypothetical protein JHK85_027933 [Glycine max]KAH1137311.1 hypothetical protein GYH30_027346 [Glycine max]